MAVLVMQCPHCGAENMTFNVVSGVDNTRKGTSSVFAQCSGCFEAVVTQFAYRQAGYGVRDLLEYRGELVSHHASFIGNTYPTLPPIVAPDSTPDKVARSFIEATKSRRAQLWNAACGSYRRCMELALKEFAPEVEAWKLEKRIDRLAAEHRITPALQAWAHELRLDGNEALHGDDDATEEMTEQMHHLTYFLLTYLYTLPNQIEEVRVRREAASE
jgi:hypothetical protein